MSFFFILIGIHSMQGWTATTRYGVTRKRSTKRLKHTGNFFRRNLKRPLSTSFVERAPSPKNLQIVSKIFVSKTLIVWFTHIQRAPPILNLQFHWPRYYPHIGSFHYPLKFSWTTFAKFCHRVSRWKTL